MTSLVCVDAWVGGHRSADTYRVQPRGNVSAVICNWVAQVRRKRTPTHMPCNVGITQCVGRAITSPTEGQADRVRGHASLSHSVTHRGKESNLLELNECGSWTGKRTPRPRASSYSKRFIHYIRANACQKSKYPVGVIGASGAVGSDLPATRLCCCHFLTSLLLDPAFALHVSSHQAADQTGER